MTMPPRLHVHHCTSYPYHFFGRAGELRLLDRALHDHGASVVAWVGPGGQGKTAVVQHWLEQLATGTAAVDGIFLWSFYRGQDVDLCLRELYAFAADRAHLPDVSATYCVDHLLPILRQQRFVLVFDGTEVVQYDAGPWFGRFVHPDLGRLLEEVASAALPGLVLLTSRFPLPELERRPHARLLALGSLDVGSARALLRSLGVRGSDDDLEEAAASCGFHAKAVELLGTLLVAFHEGDARAHRTLPDTPAVPDGSEEEKKVGRVLSACRDALSPEARDILALATAFRAPPTESRLLEYLASRPVETLLHSSWARPYPPFGQRGPAWLGERVQELIAMRLLERVGLAPGGTAPGDDTALIDAHPLVRRTFEPVLGTAGHRQSAEVRAGFLRARPDRRRAATLEEAREDIDLFHAYCDAGQWEEADATLVALDKPRYRFLAPALERDLLLRFFPKGDWRQPPLWPAFRQYRGLAICLELLGFFEEAVCVYRGEDEALRGDALIALGRLGPLLHADRPPRQWSTLWQAYRAHALCLAGRTAEAVALAGSLVPVDVYEWTHVFECLLRAGRLAVIDMHSFLYRPPAAAGQRWSDLARQRMRADYLRVTASPPPADLEGIYRTLQEDYDRGGLPYERALTRLGHARWLLAQDQPVRAHHVNAVTLKLARRYGMPIMEADAWQLEAEVRQRLGEEHPAEAAAKEAGKLRHLVSYEGPARP